jgi:hypothetical protein
MGLVRGGIPRELRQAADAEFPVTDFVPTEIIKATVGWLARHPLRAGAALPRARGPAPHGPRLSPQYAPTRLLPSV